MKPLRIALEKVDLLPPDRVTDNTSVLTLRNLVLEPLLGWDRGRATPALFAHWSHSADGRRWEFAIRSDATFHDGRQCEASDVIACIDALTAARDTFGMPWPYARYLRDVRISPASTNRVVIDSPEPFADILDVLSEFYVSRPGPDGSASLGTGRYRLIDHEPGQEVHLESTIHTDDPERIRLRAVPKAGDRWNDLVNGDADVAIHLDHMDIPPDPDSRFRWGRRASPMTVMAFFNCGSGLFRSPAARWAANLAIDREALVQQVFRGLAIPAATVVSPAHLGMAAGLQPIPHDPALARQLLSQTGGSRQVRLRTPTGMPERALEISHFVAAGLSDVGLDVVVETEPNRRDYALQVGRKEIADLALFDSSPHSTYRVLDDKISSATRGIWWQGYEDGETERLIKNANAAVSLPAREAAYAACLGRLRDHPPWLHLAHPVNLFATVHDAPPFHLTSKGTLAPGLEG